MHESLLARNDAILISALSRYLDDEPRWPPRGGLSAPPPPPDELADLIRKTRRMTRGQLLANPLTVPLPALPQTRGSSNDFTREVRERLQTFRKRWHLFRPLVRTEDAPIVVEVG
jgi:hypothetical protein